MTEIRNYNKPPNKGLYSILKGQAYQLAITTAGRGNTEAQTAGFAGVYDLTMSDSDHDRQAQFLIRLPDFLSE